MTEREQRIENLRKRGLSQRAAEIVIDAAMFGKGCLAKEYADKQAAQRTGSSSNFGEQRH